jgi:Domain of unknown function (DUF4129)
MMRSLTAPAPTGGAELRAAVAAAVPAALAEASVLCLPLHTVVTGGAGSTIPVAMFIVLFLAAFAAAVALATRYRASARVAPIVAIGAVAIGVLLARGGVQREIFVVLLFLLVGLRAVGLAFRDWREPIAASFLVGALVLAVESVVGAAARQDCGPSLVALMPVFFVASLASRAVSVWTMEDAQEVPPDERDRWARRAIASTLWIPVAMVVAAVLGLRDGVLDHLGSILAPIGNAVVSALIFVFTQLARPIFWLVDALGIDPDGARRVLDRAARSAAHARTRAIDRVGEPSVFGRLLGLALFVLVVWLLVRFMRRLRPEPVASDRAVTPPAASVSRDVLASPPGVPTRTVSHEPPADRVRRWYGEVMTALARRGVVMDQAMTPAEFAPEVAEAYPGSAEAFVALTRAYEDVRYGSAHLDPSMLGRLETDVRALLATIRRQPPRSTEA